MDEGNFKERVKRLQEVNKVIERLDPAIREVAFSLLKDYVSGKGGAAPQKKLEGKNGSPPEDMEEFFTKFNQDKPAENAQLVAAYHYSQYGSEAFSLEEIREIATEAGITIPERLDMTFLRSRREGKNLFRRAGRGMFKPTVQGEAILKQTYSISKGRKKKIPEDQK